MLPTVMYSLTGKYLFATAAAGLPIAILQTRTPAKAAIRMQFSTAAAH